MVRDLLRRLQLVLRRRHRRPRNRSHLLLRCVVASLFIFIADDCGYATAEHHGAFEKRARAASARRTSSWTRSALMAIAAADPAPAAVITCARGSTTFPAAQTPTLL